MTTFKKIAVVSLIALAMTSVASAQQYNNTRQRQHNNSGNWVVPALIGGAIVYGVTQANRPVTRVETETVYVDRPVYIERQVPPPGYLEAPTMSDRERSERYLAEPMPRFETPRIYEDRYMWDPAAQVWRKVSVRIR